MAQFESVDQMLMRIFRLTLDLAVEGTSNMQVLYALGIMMVQVEEQ